VTLHEVARISITQDVKTMLKHTRMIEIDITAEGDLRNASRHIRRDSVRAARAWLKGIRQRIMRHGAMLPL
jgi:hypothetical protein